MAPWSRRIMRWGHGGAYVRIAGATALLALGCRVETEGLAATRTRDAGFDAGTIDAPMRDASAPDAYAPDVPPIDAAGPDCMIAVEACNGLDDDCDGIPDDEGCPCDAVPAFGKVYLFCAPGADWHTARDTCEALTGYGFVAIESADEDGWLWNEAHGRVASSWWMGLFEPTPGVYRWTNGTDVWNVGSTGAYHNFAGGMPEYSVPDDCGQLSNGADGQWDEGGCTDAQPYICEASP